VTHKVGFVKNHSLGKWLLVFSKEIFFLRKNVLKEGNPWLSNNIGGCPARYIDVVQFKWKEMRRIGQVHRMVNLPDFTSVFDHACD